MTSRDDNEHRLSAEYAEAFTDPASRALAADWDTTSADGLDEFDEHFAALHRRDADPVTREAVRKTIDEMVSELPDDE
jgi:hypothetical protein